MLASQEAASKANIFQAGVVSQQQPFRLGTAPGSSLEVPDFRV
jgi:hypothetical protein